MCEARGEREEGVTGGEEGRGAVVEAVMRAVSEKSGGEWPLLHWNRLIERCGEGVESSVGNLAARLALRTSDDPELLRLLSTNSRHLFR